MNDTTFQTQNFIETHAILIEVNHERHAIARLPNGRSIQVYRRQSAVNTPASAFWKVGENWVIRIHVCDFDTAPAIKPVSKTMLPLTLRQILLTPKDSTFSEEASPMTVQGWVRTKRDSKGFSFLAINDGSCLGNLQIVVDHDVPGADQLPKILTGASIKVEGTLVPSPAQGQLWEFKAASLEVLGFSPPEYPLQKKGHSVEFLREINHLRPRTNLLGAVFRLRSKMAAAVHDFFQSREFVYAHTPIITTNDCEGAGEMFRVTTHDRNSSAKAADDFFRREAYLTVSGQLEGEAMACALGRIYTFGPTFRAENSNTARHAAEFWMIEPEIAFCDLELDMSIAESMLRELTQKAITECADELNFFERLVEPGLVERLRQVVERPFVRLSYTEAVEKLKASGQKFEYDVEWGAHLQTEHERYLTEVIYQCPVIVYHYPASIKPFYMRQNGDDPATVAAMDVLVPRVGELIGGSQREERLDLLIAAMEKRGLNLNEYAWYADLRRFGSVPHAGFGLGFERLLMFLSGVQNIRDVIPFPRTPGHA